MGTGQDLGGKTSACEKKLTNEAMMNITCDDIVMETKVTVLRGEKPYSIMIMELPYAGYRAMLHIKKTWITLKYKEEIFKAQRTDPMRVY